MPPIYPFLIAIFPALALFSGNVQEIPLEQSYRSIAAAILGCALLYAVLGVALKNAHKAAAITAATLLLFFSYGHVYSALKPVTIARVLIGRHRYLVPLFLLIMVVVLRYVLNKRRSLQGATTALNLISAAMLITPILSIASFIYKLNTAWAWQTPDDRLVDPSDVDTTQSVPPDIYYIILDGYARQDVMLSEFDLDISNFVNTLEARGFYVADQSHTNHNWTAMSLASSLNMDYVQDLGLDLVPRSYPGVFVDPIVHSRVRRKLEALGYTIVGLRSGYLPTEWVDADLFLTPEAEPSGAEKSGIRLNAFESQLLHSTALKVILDFLPPGEVEKVGFRTNYPHELLREIILAAFDYLAEAPSTPGPKFVFAHIVAPHSPYLFGPNGEELDQLEPYTLGIVTDGTDAGDKAKYRAQAVYVTKRIEEALDAILTKSETPPIIIGQADHGPGEGEGRRSEGEGLRQRMRIFNAYYLPPDCDDDPYPAITPVNSFRIVFDCAFGDSLGLLEDHTYYSYWPRTSAYHFILKDDELVP